MQPSLITAVAVSSSSGVQLSKREQNLLKSDGFQSILVMAASLPEVFKIKERIINSLVVKTE
jgi:hypothetical protein